MRSAFALRIISGRIIYNFGTPERLRTLRGSIFTGGVVEKNGICRAGFLRKHSRGGEPSPVKKGVQESPQTFLNPKIKNNISAEDG